MSKIKDISVMIIEKEISSGKDVHGSIDLNYQGRFDSIIINSQIQNSSDVFNYTDINGKKINHPYARLAIFREDIGDNKTLKFIANTKHVPSANSSNVKFRVTIIQEHKEVASDVTNIKIVKS
ncbi:MAG: hypothetical protein ICV56_09095 [Nitrososphaeraceae archaeon]|nr:hypothetical protein [Nitrososphaeraceae archaeon]